MNYKNIVNIIKEIVEDHYFINTWGYGELSDIMTPENQKPPQYPYMFMNPVSIIGGNRSDSFTFNLICMTQAYDTEVDTIEEQSNCMVYLKDVISKVNMTLDHPLITFDEPYTFTPFKERFQDDVVGVTAQMTITYSNALDNCFTKISGGTITEVPGPPVKVVDGDESIHYVNPGESYSCLPATAKEGIFYQRVIPWEGNDPNLDGSVYWHLQNGTYNYTPPSNPLYISCKDNKYNGDDTNCILMQKNAFDNFFRFTNDRGQQFIEDFHKNPSNQSENPQYCIDHLTGLGFYVQMAVNERESRSYVQSIDYANNFSYGGYDDWRLADIAEYLGGVSYNDWQNSFNLVYCPFIDEGLRSYGGRLILGSFTKDNQYISVITNSATIGTRSDINELYANHLIMVRNHYI